MSIIDATIGRVIAAGFRVGELLSILDSKWQARKATTEYRVEMEAFRKQCEAYERMQERARCKARHPAGKGLFEPDR